ncbi:MAG: hypothetical protein LC749_10320 [Actinobacteria bacterium]|nr:hypothetical protein [Actinomycetota bacterium]
MTIDCDALRTDLGTAILDYGTHISASEARRWACDAKIIPVVLSGKSDPLDVERSCEPSHYPSAERWSREIAGGYVHHTGGDILIYHGDVAFIPPHHRPHPNPTTQPPRC